jgi:hypothetical protein
MIGSWQVSHPTGALNPAHGPLGRQPLPPGHGVLPALRRKERTVIPGFSEIAYITTKQDMSRWTRAHADAPGINWSVFAGPGGTMIIVEGEERCSPSTTTSRQPLDSPSASALTGADTDVHPATASITARVGLPA